MISRVCAIVLAAGVLGAAHAPDPPAAFKVIGYYADWTSPKYPLASIPANKLTHVNYAFGKIGLDNRLTWNASLAVDQVYPDDCRGAGCPHGLFNQIAVLKKKYSHL